MTRAPKEWVPFSCDDLLFVLLQLVSRQNAARSETTRRTRATTAGAKHFIVPNEMGGWPRNHSSECLEGTCGFNGRGCVSDRSRAPVTFERWARCVWAVPAIVSKRLCIRGVNSR